MTNAYGIFVRGLVIALVVALATALSSPADAAAKKKRRAVPPPPMDAALIVDATSGRVLYERNAYAIRHPASLTKMMTLYMLFEALEKGTLTMNSPLVASKFAAAQSPTKIDVRPGESITVDLAIRAIVIRSANDVAVVIAEALGGSEGNFGEMMTRRAREIGMPQTVFVNASGLPDIRQITTAADMAMLGRRVAYDFPQYYHYFSLPSFSYKGRTYNTHDHLLRLFAGTDGIKTGYTRMSGFNLVSSAIRDNKHLVGAVLGGSSGASRDREMMRLLQIGFDEAEKNPLLVAYANVPWSANQGAKTRPDWNAPRPPSIELAGYLGKKAVPSIPVPSPSETPTIAIAMAPIPDRVPAAVAAAPAPKLHDILPKPKPVMAVAKAEPPKPDPIAALIEAEQSKAVGVDGASYVPAGRLASILPAPNPLRIASRNLRQNVSFSTDAAVETASGNMRRWAVQIGAYADRATALVHLTKYAERSMDVVGQAKRLVVPLPGSSGQVLYRARFGLFGENEARAVCRRMTSRGETCFAVMQAAG